MWGSGKRPDSARLAPNRPKYSKIQALEVLGKVPTDRKPEEVPLAGLPLTAMGVSLLAEAGYSEGSNRNTDGRSQKRLPVGVNDISGIFSRGEA